MIIYKRLKYKITLFMLYYMSIANAQPVPTAEENIPYLVTFGKKAKTSFGDDDFSQTFYFVIPKEQMDPFYIRIFDPNVGGLIDEVSGEFDTKTTFEIYGGNNIIPKAKDALYDPVGDYKKGILLNSETFGAEMEYDNKWFTFGPFNPVEGDLQPQMGGYIFKIIAEGTQGDDGNLYRYFLSSSSDGNVPVQGGNAFTYEYTFRLSDEGGSTSHIYPYIDDRVIAVTVNIFDFDNDGFIRVISVAKRGEKLNKSADDIWAESKFGITEEEKKTSLDIQFIKFNASKNNNLVVHITNQYSESLPFYTIPIGGYPKYNYKIGVKVGRD